MQQLVAHTDKGLVLADVLTSIKASVGMVAHVGSSTHALPAEPTTRLRHVRAHGSVTMSPPQMVSLAILVSKSVVFVANKETFQLGQGRFKGPEGAASEISASQFALAPTPIKVEVLEKWLNGYNQMDSYILFNGFKYGFRLNYEGIRKERFSKNLKSAAQYESVVQDKIDKEIKAGRVAGPFNQVPLPHLQISPIGIVPKKSPGENRLIHHLSYPLGQSINDFIDPRVCSVK